MTPPIYLFANISTFENIFVFKKENKDNWKPRSFKFINLIISLETVFAWQSGLDLVSVLGRGGVCRFYLKQFHRE